MERYGEEESYEEAIKDEFVNGDELDLLIVVDKLLTGFDAPRATVMYIDKPMKGTPCCRQCQSKQAL